MLVRGDQEIRRRIGPAHEPFEFRPGFSATQWRAEHHERSMVILDELGFAETAQIKISQPE
jgi:hypothetical protein